MTRMAHQQQPVDVKEQAAFEHGFNVERWTQQPSRGRTDVRPTGVARDDRRRRAGLRRQRRQRTAFLLGEIGFHRVLGDWGAQIPVFGVLGENHAGDLRLVVRREEHEPAVIADVHLALHRLGSRERNHLRGPGLAGDVESWHARPAARAGGIDDHPQPLVQGRNRRIFHLHRRLRRRRRNRLPPLAVVNGLDDVRGVTRAAVGDRHHHDGERDRRDVDLPLSDGHRDRLAGIPRSARRSSSSTPSTAPGP